jgi:hypothetical protein
VGVGTTNPSLFTLQVAGNVGPNANDTYDLGASGTAWRNLYVNNIISPSGATGQMDYWNRTASGGFNYLAPNTTADVLSIGQSTGLTASGLSVKVNALGNAAAYVENTGAGPLLTASSSGATKFTIDASGNILSVAGAKWEPLTNSTTALNIANAAGTSFVNFDTTNSKVKIGSTFNYTDTNLSKLHVGGSGTGRGTILENTSSDVLTLWSDANGGSGYLLSLGSQVANDLSLADDNGNTLLYVTDPNGNGASPRFGFGPFGNSTINLQATFDLRGTGNTIPVASISGATGKAALVVDNASGDLFTASSSGLNRFVITQAGNIGVGTTTPGSTAGIPAGLTEEIKGTGDVNLALTSTGNQVAQIFFGANGALSSEIAYNNTSSALQFLVGGTNQQSEHFEMDQTGKTGLGFANGIGTTSLLSTLDVRPVSGTLSVASLSGQTSFAGLIVDNSGSGDLFTASSSGLNRFVITQAGNVGYWDNVPRETRRVLGRFTLLIGHV